MNRTSGFSRRGPDRVTEELASVLSKKASFEFKPLFELVHANLRARNAANGGEEMLRLRAYEKLQNMVQQGVVKKTGKKYRGVTAPLAVLLDQIKTWATQPLAQFTSAKSAAQKKAAAVAAEPAV